VLQFIVRLMSRVMVVLLGTSGAETLSVSANVFMGQTEAPLVIRPFIARMTRSELLTLMVGGMATISGSLMAVYIDMINKAIPDAREASAAVAGILATSVMAAPASLYVSKLILPETETPETLGEVRTAVENPHANVIDAAAAGASDGLMLALNVAAMLIAFVAGVALINAVLAGIGGPTWSLGNLFAAVFAPVAFLMGVEGRDVRAVADLLGTKLVLNEFVAYTRLRDEYAQQLSLRSVTLTTYALTGFANFSSIGIQIGGIGGMARERRRDLAELSLRALLAGFLVTLINASLAGILLP
jgi:CNT family concentrative nucleoside transporter